MKIKLIGNLLFVFVLATFAAFAQEDQIQLTTRNNVGHTHKTSNGIKSTSLEYRGTIVFNEYDTDVISISKGGFLKISQRTFGTRRTVLLEGKSDGTISREFTIGGREYPWDPDGSEWLADVLLEVIRSSGLGADTRVARFHRKGGADAVIDEIQEIESDFVQSIYFSSAVKLNDLSSSDMNKFIVSASDEIGSDYELSSFFIKNSSIFSQTNSSLSEVLNSTTEISSDFEQARVLKHFLDEHDLTTNQLNLLLDASNEISSDFEHAGVLLKMNDKVNLSSGFADNFLKSVEEISSDFEAARVLKAVINKQEMSNSIISQIIEVSNGISSDFEQAGVLKTLTGLDLDFDNLREVANATDNISSDFEKSGLLITLLNNNKFKEEDLASIIGATKNISSDFEHSKVLKHISKQGQLSDNNFKAIIDACDEISSDFEHSGVLKSLIGKNELNVSKSLYLLSSIEALSSNFEKTGVLIEMGSKIPDDARVHEAFRETAKTVSSDFDYGRIMRSVDF